MPRIDRATPADFLAVAALDREAWSDNAHATYIPDGEHVWRIWCEHALTYVARGKEGRIDGVVLAFPCVEPSCYCLHKIMVRHDARGQGIAPQLMAALLIDIDRLGADLFLTVDPANAKAINLYERWGFTDRSFVAGYYRPEEDRLILTRKGILRAPTPE